MRNHRMPELAACTEFRQALQAHPPRLVHGTMILLGGLLGTALLWAQLTKADLVVRAPCVVRPLTSRQDATAVVSGEKVSTRRTGAVVEVNYQVGSKVRKGDVLLRLDTKRIELDIEDRKRHITAGEEELSQLRT